MIIYVSVLYIRYNAGIVTDEMMAIPKFRFVIIGLLEALGVVAGMSSGGAVDYLMYLYKEYMGIYFSKHI